ncbi:hypothetical protein SLA2020_473500 [Shorea laevis]
MDIIYDAVKCLGRSFLILIFKKIIIVRRCNENVENLKKEVDKLKIQRDAVKRHVEELGRQGEETLPNLQTWLNRAEDFIEVADKLLELLVNKTPTTSVSLGCVPVRYLDTNSARKHS